MKSRTPPDCLLTVAYFVRGDTSISTAALGACQCLWVTAVTPEGPPSWSSLRRCSPDLCAVNSETSEFLLFYLSDVVRPFLAELGDGPVQVA